MLSKNKLDRLSALRKIPPIARKDHRLYLDQDGELPWTSNLTRKERRKLAAESRKIGLEYKKIMERIYASGAGFPTDQLLRQMAVEYTNRYASSGVENQPVSFNYFEPFCDIRLIQGSVAPYADTTDKLDHLFDITDFFDFLTSSDSDGFDLGTLAELPESMSFHFTTSGDVLDLTFLAAEGREFAISGFTMVRRMNSLHWYLIGGEILSEEEWHLRSSDQPDIDLQNILPSKRAFLRESIEENEYKTGAPVPLEGTDTAIRTVIAGEIDLTTKKHLGRCYMSETENSFAVFCDDPEICIDIADAQKRDDVIKSMMDHIDQSAPLWDLAEALFQLPSYFAHKVTVAKEVFVAAGKRQVRSNKGGRGIAARYKIVSAIDIVDTKSPTIRTVHPPHYKIETEGHWRRLSTDAVGRDRDGNKVPGKTWVKSKSQWRDREQGSRVVYVKNPIAAARLTAAEYQEAAEASKANAVDLNTDTIEGFGELYVLRCAAMEDQVFKVGWTSGSSSQRAEQLSKATGVPLSFVVVNSWKHPDAEALETEVHMMLAPYRINDRREFFEVRYDVIKRTVEAAIARTANKRPLNSNQ